METKSFIKKIISNPILQTLAVYISSSWILIELLEYLIENFNINESLRNVLLILLLCALPVALIISWMASREKDNLTLYREKKKPAGKISRIFRNPKYSIPVALVLLLLFAFGIRYLNYRAKSRWAKESALDEIEQLAYEFNFIAAFELLKKAERYIPEDSRFKEYAKGIIIKQTILTEPEGADVYIREYLDTISKWRYLGVTPIDSIELPIFTFFQFKIEKEGYDQVLAAGAASKTDTLYRKLFRGDEFPEGMVHVYYYADEIYDKLTTPKNDFYLDRYEVTNEQYKVFVDQGAYRNKEFWKHEFIREGNLMTWEEAMALFTDKTGRPGPSTWEASDYPENQEKYPVSGISWYEAAAYAEFAGKSLPTVYHWGSAAGLYSRKIWYSYGSYIRRNSNFSGEGPGEVGKNSGINCFGAYDMAGNVREWCWNSTQNGHIIRGGSWNDSEYMFGNWSNLPSFDRSPGNGFRCVKYIDSENIPKEDFEPINFEEERDYNLEEPVDEHTFSIFRKQFLYDNIELDTRLEDRDDRADDWIIEKVTFNAAYGNERVIAYLYLPKNSKPPYQTLIFFPGSYGVTSKSILRSGYTRYYSDFLLKNGRAVMFPVYKGTYERNDGLTLDMHIPNLSHQFTDWLVKWSKDLSRSIDYLESRPDIDSDKIGYYAHSWGGEVGGVIPAVEKRLGVSILVLGGFSGQAFPEADAINYVPRITCPVLMLNGKYDLTFPYEATVVPFYNLLGTDKKDKHLIVTETDHYVPKDVMIRETLKFLDTYFGPVK